MRRRYVLQGALLVGTLIALSSAGGAAAYAAPVLLPLQFMAARGAAGRSLGLVWTVLGAATGAEGTGALTYVPVGETQPVNWLLPALAAGLAAATKAVGSRAPRRA